MLMPRELLISIAERASTIWERLDGGFSLPEVADIGVDAYLQTWCQLIAEGNQRLFEKRLAWDNLSMSTLRRVLGEVKLEDPRHIPAWAEFLAEAVETATLVRGATISASHDEPGRWEPARILRPDAPVPFEEAFLPFVAAARARLTRRAAASYELLTDEAHAALERGLLGMLAFYCAPAFYTVFSSFRAGRQSSFGRLIAELQGDTGRDMYDEFITRLYQGQLLVVFGDYPALARLMSQLSTQWVSATEEFLQRLQHDMRDLAGAFNGSEDLGRVVSVNASLSDRHNGGRRVIALTFACGLKLIYKPRDHAVEEAYYALLEWVNERCGPRQFRILKVLNRSTHGWSEFVEHSLCGDDEQLRRYYQRAGALLGLLYALVGTDAHCENVIAEGEWPVLVDTETLLHPPAPYEQEQQPDQRIRALTKEQTNHSVLRTGILPTWEFGAEGQLYDSSPLREVSGQETVVLVPRFRHTNTNNMTFSSAPAPIKEENHLPLAQGAESALPSHAEDLIHGFSAIYRFLLAHRRDLQAPDGPLARFAGLRTRFLHRASRFYMGRLLESLQTHCLRDGVHFSVHLDVFSREMLKSESRPHLWPLLRAEQQALQQLDVPYFLVQTSDGEVLVPTMALRERCWAASSYELMTRRLDSMSEADLLQQIGLARASLYFHGAYLKTEGNGNGGHGGMEADRFFVMEVEDSATKNAFLAPADAVGIATSIMRSLQERAVPIGDDAVTWLACEPRFQGERHHFLPLGYNLYEGSSGVALFLAAQARITGAPEPRRLALATLQPLREKLRSQATIKKIVDVIGLGGALGCGSLIYSLVLSADLLETPSLLEDAARIAHQITPERVAADTRYDVTSGAAGALLGLLALHQANPDHDTLQRALECGRHLLKHRVASQGGLRAWITGPAPILAGFAHGTAGIAYALLQMYQASDDASFLRAASEAITYESSIYCEQAGNWPDLRSPVEADGRPAFMMAWCNGAPGIGLARLGGLQMLTSDLVQQDIERAITATRAFGPGNLDHLCCGSLGRIELLQMAARLLGRPDLLEEAHTLAGAMAARVRQSGFFELSALLPRDIFAPGFFQGVSGIGYSFLRLTHPQILPSVLLWQLRG
jgi:type 2 lantibiotic biosynthesis protein LanM